MFYETQDKIIKKAGQLTSWIILRYPYSKSDRFRHIES